MRLDVILKQAAGFWALGLVLAVPALIYLLPAFVRLLGAVLVGLNNFGAG